ncbi:hypothetical protein [Nocardioides sp. P86]|uniref:hypothetical protein n=1 Tax=Nocardioides sp. P86 TaxID=2939569 RepID=UPI00203C8A32|nr:hypothetical protein [Nocardioides sp. P86]MCM3516941.1 hypothetical protein [Nocardioides sp. P86]
MTDQAKTPAGNRARWLVPAAVLVLLVVVGGVILLIGLLQGDDTDLDPPTPVEEQSSSALALPVDPASVG